jgi:hypothetical protein
MPGQFVRKSSKEDRRLHVPEVVWLQERRLGRDHEPPLTCLLVDNVSQKLVGGPSRREKCFQCQAGCIRRSHRERYTQRPCDYREDSAEQERDRYSTRHRGRPLSAGPRSCAGPRWPASLVGSRRSIGHEGTRCGLATLPRLGATVLGCTRPPVRTRQAAWNRLRDDDGGDVGCG